MKPLCHSFKVGDRVTHRHKDPSIIGVITFKHVYSAEVSVKWPDEPNSTNHMPEFLMLVAEPVIEDEARIAIRQLEERSRLKGERITRILEEIETLKESIRFKQAAIDRLSVERAKIQELIHKIAD